MKQHVVLGVYFLSVCFSNVHLERLFPPPIDYCLRQLDKVGFNTADASTAFLQQCLIQFNSSLTPWDHPWIISLYKGIFKAHLCKIHETEACKQIRIRKEYRQLSDEERHLFHSAILELYKETSVPPNKFMALVLLHRDEHAQVAHGGPPFIIWHRLFLSMFEEALRQINRNITIPYWDMTIDKRLPDAALSNIWTEDFIGNGFGRITKGIFKDWSHDRGFLERYLGNNDELPSMETIVKVLHYPFTKLEYVHNASHAFVGGDMRDASVSPSDPVFWLLHTFYDLVWDYFLKEQTLLGKDITKLYPDNKVYPLNRSISLIPLTIQQALEVNVLLSKYVYTFSQQPTCLLHNHSCNSSYLTCINKQCVPSNRDCNEGPITDNYCRYVKCKPNWTVVEIGIYISYSNHNKQRCKATCNNASPVNLYSNGFRQRTVYFNSSISEVNVEAVVEMFTSFQDIVVTDSCSNPCVAYCLVNDTYVLCEGLTFVTVIKDYEDNSITDNSNKNNNNKTTSDENSNKEKKSNIKRRKLLFKCSSSLVK